jgi:polyisoprenyl-teichoic acid--peptidoglycan teichoic acid transferase
MTGAPASCYTRLEGKAIVKKEFKRSGNRSSQEASWRRSLKKTPSSSFKLARGDRGAITTRWIWWSFAFLLVTIVSASLGATLALIGPFDPIAASQPHRRSIAELLQKGTKFGISRPVNVLVMGIDQVPGTKDGSPESFASRSDTMLLARVDPEGGNLNILSIPRDTQVEIPGVGVTKINHANWEGGPDLAQEVVSQTLNGVAVDRYVRFSTSAFRELVDVVGGIKVYVPERMYYTDQTQGLTIDLQPGLQTLNGQQAEGFVRFRNDQYGDIGRAQRQQMLLKALQKRLTNPLILTRMPEVFNVIQKHVDTNLSLGEMLALLQFGMRLDANDLRMVLLPGRFSTPGEYYASYWLMDSAGVDQVMQSYFDVRPLSYQPQGEEPLIYSLRIAVQNASRDPNAAQEVADYLGQQGFQNVYVDGDWPQIQPQTEVIVQRGDLKAAQTLAGSLGMTQVSNNSTGSIDSDLTIRVGETWAQQQQTRADSSTQTESSW